MTSSLLQQIRVVGAAVAEVNGVFSSRDPKVIPAGFARTCVEMGWDSQGMWRKLSDQKRPWFEKSNEAYMYYNIGDGQWWLDGPSGAGLYVVKADSQTPPTGGWRPLGGVPRPAPTIEAVPQK